jgi:hypothetical protein
VIKASVLDHLVADREDVVWDIQAKRPGARYAASQMPATREDTLPS